MAATKEGLDYFPFDVDLLDNDDLDFLREKYGVVVNDVYITLLTLLYRKKGYYIPYGTETERKDCIWYVYKRVRGGKHPIQQGLIPIVVEAIAAQGLFVSGDLFNKIITSERAQKTYYKATVERKLESFNIIPEYWLLDDETMRKLSKVHPYYLSLHSESKSDDLEDKSDDLEDKSDDLAQSKVNIISNEVIKVSKKVSNKDIDGYKGITRARKSYQELMDTHEIPKRVQVELWKFIQHCQANGQIVTNDRLQSLWLKLIKLYRLSDEKGMVQAIRTAIDKGYYDIKDGEGWIAEAVKAMRASGMSMPEDDIDDTEDEEHLWKLRQKYWKTGG
ncbi:MAG: DUF4373 domain-containing protein [Roseburia sp.]|nr:DUF4373 domain-containing protein [Roseburia sp.]